MELSGQNVTIIVVALAVVALLFYALYKGRTAKLTSKLAGNEIGVELAGMAQPPEVPGEVKGATSVGNIEHNKLLEEARLRGNQQIHVGHNVGTPAPQPKPESKDR